MNLAICEERIDTCLLYTSDLPEVDWSKTTAVQVRSNYIYVNLKGRDAHGIVDPADQYALEERIIDDLYSCLLYTSRCV